MAAWTWRLVPVRARVRTRFLLVETRLTILLGFFNDLDQLTSLIGVLLPQPPMCWLK
jgi:hypothetical protein